MTGSKHPRDDTHRYEIRVDGTLDARWSAWFEGAGLEPMADGTTRIECPLMDQSALHGLLGRIRDSALPLVSVTRIDDTPPPTPPTLRRSTTPCT